MREWHKPQYLGAYQAVIREAGEQGTRGGSNRPLITEHWGLCLS